MELYTVIIGYPVGIEVYHLVAEDKGMAEIFARDLFHHDHPDCDDYKVRKCYEG